MAYYARPFCGCWYVVYSHHRPQKKYLPQVDLESKTTVLSRSSQTILRQTFFNPSKTEKLDEVRYTFPLYDGVSVVGFRCTVAHRTIVGVVKEKHQARADYKEAVQRGETAGLLEQLDEAADVFTTKIGNVPPDGQVMVELTYLGELKHDAESDGARFSIPTFIAPRYGPLSMNSQDAFGNQAHPGKGIRILIDVAVEEASVIKGIQSPSHPIAVTMGRTSDMDEDAFASNHASATLALQSMELDKDFIILILAKDQDTPQAWLETHSSIPDQRALMMTLVPRFNLPNILPEIVFVADRSGSMDGKIGTLVAAMKIFLKSLPTGVKFNICSFGSTFDFLFPRSKAYDQGTLDTALRHLETFESNYGGTEMQKPVKATVKNRYKDMPLEVMIITDGQIWDQKELFDLIAESTRGQNARFFSLGIGSGASSTLVEGIARAGDGFAQFVGDNERMDRRAVRMLKGALTPHINDYTLEVKYEADAATDEFEIIESPKESLDVQVTDRTAPTPITKKVISLFDKSAKEQPTTSSTGPYDHLPIVNAPKIIQAPHSIPPLYPFNRTTAYLILSEEACQRNPKAVVLRASSEHGPLELEIPVHDIGHGQMLHQLAARKAIQELEEGRGWITDAKDTNGKLLKSRYEGRWDEMVEREGVRLGVRFQVAGKWCSFVAIERDNGDIHAPASEEILISETRDEIHGNKKREYNRNAQRMFLSRREVSLGQIDTISKESRRSVSPAYLGTLGSASPSSPPQPRPPLNLAAFAASFASAEARERAPSSAPRGFGSSASVRARFSSRGMPVASSEDSDQERRRRSVGGLTDSEDSDIERTMKSMGEGQRLEKDDDVSEMTFEEKMHRIIALQNFDGSWNLNDALLALLGVTRDELCNRLKEIFQGQTSMSQSLTDKVQATAAAAVFLEVKVQEEKDVWEMVVEKAKGWIKTAIGVGGLEAAEKAAHRLFQ